MSTSGPSGPLVLLKLFSIFIVFQDQIEFIEVFYFKYGIYKPREVEHMIEFLYWMFHILRFFNPIFEIEYFNKLYSTCILLQPITPISETKSTGDVLFAH